MKENKMKKQRGFTLVEILVSLTILIVGVVGILTLFPAGINSTRLAIEDTYAAMVAESAYSSLRASVQKMAPGDPLVFFHDGIDVSKRSFDISTVQRGETMGIPAPRTKVAQNQYLSPTNLNLNPTTGLITLQGVKGTNGGTDFFCPVGQTKFTDPNPSGNFALNMKMGEDDPGQLSQFSFNIEINYPPIVSGSERLTPKGLFDITIRVRRDNKMVKKFHTKMFIPTTVN
jgi:prepilin-type N-terminal cleavage/methylation domain-containing protein